MSWFFERRKRRERELDEELRFHLDEEAEERAARGLAGEEARHAARRDLGNIGLIKENTRDVWGWTALEQLWQDIRFGARALRKSPGFTATAVATLALAIGINTTVVTVANTVLFKGFPLVKRNDRIVYITTGVGCCVSWPDFQDWRAQASSFEGMAIVHGVQRTIVDTRGYPEICDATEVSADTFRLTGQGPILGRDFTPADETSGAAPVAVLSYGLWERRYGKDPAIVGKVLRVNNAATSVIGVMPRGFTFPQKADLWVPLVVTPNVLKRSNRETWFVFARLAPRVTIETARAEMEIIGRRLGNAYPLTNRGRNLLPHVLNFRDFFIGPNATAIYEAMFGAVAFVLLIACANLANLLLSRSVVRSREISVRMALGAGRWRIIRQLLVESVLLSGMGGAVGWWIARWGVRAYTLNADGAGLSDAIEGAWFDHVLDYSMDYRVLLYCIAISIGTGLLFGLLPTLRLSKFDVIGALKDGGRGSTSGGRVKRLSGLIVTAEVALAIVLLAGAGVTIRSFLNVYTVGTGVRADHVLAAQLPLPRDRYRNDEARVLFHDRLAARVKAMPGVESFAIAEYPPTHRVRRVGFEIAGSRADPQNRPTMSVMAIGPGYFTTLGAAVTEGRDFSDADGASGPPVALVNQRLASRLWPGEDPVGRRIRFFDGERADEDKAEEPRTVVGVVTNIAQNTAAGGEMNDLAYRPWRQKTTGTFWLFMRTGVAPATLGNALRRGIQAVDPELPILQGPSALSQMMGRGYAFKGSIAVLLAIFAATALLLAATGLYAVIAHSVSRRTQEIGIRVAIGATSTDIRRLVYREGMIPLGVGLAIGLAAALAVTPVLKSILVQVSPADPVAFAGASAALILAALLGCAIPARRAIRVDPVDALRHD